MSPRGAAPGALSTPEEEAGTVRTVILVSALLLVAATVLRAYIFGWGYGPLVTASSYDRPVPLHRFALTKDETPEGFTGPSGLPTRGDVLTGDAADQALRTAGVASPVRPAGVIVVPYAGPGGRHLLVALRFPRPEDAGAVAGALTVQDTTALVLVTPPGAADTALAQALRRAAETRKRDRVKLEKLRTAGNATLCFLMDLLVGAFFFILALFLAKYFLILRVVER